MNVQQNPEKLKKDQLRKNEEETKGVYECEKEGERHCSGWEQWRWGRPWYSVL